MPIDWLLLQALPLQYVGRIAVVQSMAIRPLHRSPFWQRDVIMEKAYY